MSREGWARGCAGGRWGREGGKAVGGGGGGGEGGRDREGWKRGGRGGRPRMSEGKEGKRMEQAGERNAGRGKEESESEEIDVCRRAARYSPSNPLLHLLLKPSIASRG